MFNALLPVLGVGLLVVGAMLFWAAIQNWVAGLIHRLNERLGRAAYIAQSALVVLDRVMVNGQRLYVATARAVFGRREAAQSETQTETLQAAHVEEEVKTVRREDLPAEVRAKLDRGETLEYELNVGSMAIKDVTARDTTTYRLAVRRAEQKRD
jgi:hypothetical protein